MRPGIKSSIGRMALNLGGLDSNAVAMTYLISNTPLFLMRELRRLAGFGRFVEANETQGLIDYIKSVDTAAERTPESVGLAYAAAAAITGKEPNALRTFLNETPLTNLVWVSEFLTIAESKRPVGMLWTGVVTTPPLIVSSKPERAASANVTLLKLD